MQTINRNIIYINKDILSEVRSRFNNNTSIIIPNLCDSVDFITSNFSNRLADTFPESEKNYSVLGEHFTKRNLGYVQYITANINKEIKNKNNIVIANMICHRYKKLNYGYLSLCMFKIKEYAKNMLSRLDTSSVEIHLSSASFKEEDQKFIRYLITDIWLDKISVFLYQK